MTQIDFAQRAGVSVGCLQAFESGTRVTRLENVERIARACALTVEELFAPAPASPPETTRVFVSHGSVPPEDLTDEAIAIARLFLDNVRHIQGSWLTTGKEIGQLSLHYGADDLGSVMHEENVVAAAGTTHRATTEDFVKTIRALGKTPVQRDTLYREVKVWN